ncbi:MAG: hypothetical protein VX642_08265 [Bdellovibrionota bacterium]|nr:hypothetical protein [Bdellovibrionota bacterium]
MIEANESLGSSVKNKLKQGFSLFDLFTTILAVFIVGAISLPILFKTDKTNELSKAKFEVMELSEKLTKQLVGNTGISSKEGSREPASVRIHSANKWEGLAGTDPWGQSYNYKVLRDAYGLPTHLIVWSKGPNGVQDTPDSELIMSGNKVSFSLDDLGHLKEIY